MVPMRDDLGHAILGGALEDAGRSARSRRSSRWAWVSTSGLRGVAGRRGIHRLGGAGGGWYYEGFRSRGAPAAIPSRQSPFHCSAA